MSFETIHGQEVGTYLAKQQSHLALTLPMDTNTHGQCQRDAPACPRSFGCGMRTHGLNHRVRTLCWLCDIPAVLGQRESNTRRLGKYHIFFLDNPGLYPRSRLRFAQTTKRTKPRARLCSLCAGDSC